MYSKGEIFLSRKMERNYKNVKNVKMASLLLLWILTVEGADQKIGFVYPHEKLNIGLEKLEFPMSFRLTFFNSLAYHKEIYDGLKVLITSIDKFPGIKDQLVIHS